MPQCSIIALSSISTPGVGAALVAEILALLPLLSLFSPVFNFLSFGKSNGHFVLV